MFGEFYAGFCGQFDGGLSVTLPSNGLSQEIVPNLRILRIFTENWILSFQKADFDDLYTIRSEFASPTRSHAPFPTVSAKNAVSENFYCQILRKISEKFGTIFGENPLPTNLMI